mmetsp:Transcript_34496/g.73497  ORF Transcript_34496/g.73497 Transcript_34496/m.73497 type:complete len:526 (-) Transcript_34496:600-2177(-)
MATKWVTTVASLFVTASSLPAEPQWYEEQLVDHFSTSTATWKQRFYSSDKYFGGPGSPIFVIIGGEGGVPPEVGIFYPWVLEGLAKVHNAAVVEPEHRFYGESLPFGQDSFTPDKLQLMNSQQALADVAHFVRAQQAKRNCTERGTPTYCPVLTIGGSYPGFLSAMMRLRYPAVVDMAYSASAPMKFYSQQVDQYAYYARVTASAERSLQGCGAAVKAAFEAYEQFAKESSVEVIAEKLGICNKGLVDADKEALVDNIEFLAQQTFANLNMANYPPDDKTAMHRTCVSFVAAQEAGGSGPLLDALKSLLFKETVAVREARANGVGKALLGPIPEVQHTFVGSSCFDVDAHLPAGPFATARCGDWSGCGYNSDGRMWDYQTCSFEVEKIGFGGPQQMFPNRSWSMSWLQDHCKRRFGTTPQPNALNKLWGFTEESIKTFATRIVWTNGLNDGWSVGGFDKDLLPARDLFVINLPNGAHHSDLSHSFGEGDTDDVKAAHARIIEMVGGWLKEIKRDGKEEVLEELHV